MQECKSLTRWSPERRTKLIVPFGLLQVSHTYEGFMDISLSIGNQQPKVRKVGLAFDLLLYRGSNWS